MICPICMGKTKVLKTQSELFTTRLRICTKCKFLFLTQESVRDESKMIEYKKYLDELNKKEADND